jgi:hypothetical protein
MLAFAVIRYDRSVRIGRALFELAQTGGLYASRKLTDARIRTHPVNREVPTRCVDAADILQLVVNNIELARTGTWCERAQRRIVGFGAGVNQVTRVTTLYGIRDLYFVEVEGNRDAFRPGRTF